MDLSVHGWCMGGDVVMMCWGGYKCSVILSGLVWGCWEWEVPKHSNTYTQHITHSSYTLGSNITDPSHEGIAV